MNKPLILLLATTTLGGAGAYAFVRSGGRIGSPGKVVFAEPEKHLVTPAMIAATDAMATQTAPTVHARGTDGAAYDLGEIAREGPLVLVFIKDGCPCSADAQRFFNRLHDAYGKEARFLGVIDSDDDHARAWGQQNRTTFPLLIDPDLAIARGYKAESSAYMAVVAKGGVIDRLYPGYSVAMLAEAGERIARLSGVTPRPIDAAGAPDELSTGCPLADRAAD
jgi:peroxiredoxin